MKNLITVFIILSIIHFSHAQKWSVGTTWIYDQIDFGPYDGENFQQLKITKDTIIDTVSYMVLRQHEINKNGFVFISNYLIKERGKKIFLYSQDDNQEKLVYDFNLNAGDTSSTFTIFENKSVSYKVISKTTDSDLGEILKVEMINTNGYYFNKIIQGIGDLDFFFVTPGFVDPPYGGGLICFKNENETIPKGTNCKITSIENLAVTNVTIYPNPSTQFIEVQGTDFFYFSIKDINGKIIQSGSRNQDKISITSLNDGMYFLQIVDENKRISHHKIIKQ